MLSTEDLAPFPDDRLDNPARLGRTVDGMLLKNGEWVPGRILAGWLELRKFVGVIKAKEKAGVKFKVRSAEDLIDRVRDKANELGILIYPRKVEGSAHVVEDGTLADLELQIHAQDVQDGSILTFAGFGLGADNQDKAGGKAGTYAFKAALIMALLAGGRENAKALGVADTDDTDTPIEGGVKPKTAGRKKGPTDDMVGAAFIAASNMDEYRLAVKLLQECSPERQLGFKAVIKEAQERLGIQPGALKKPLDKAEGQT